MPLLSTTTLLQVLLGAAQYKHSLKLVVKYGLV